MKQRKAVPVEQQGMKSENYKSLLRRGVGRLLAVHSTSDTEDDYVKKLKMKT